MLKSIKFLRHRLALGATILVLAITVTTVMPAPNVEAAGCHFFNYASDAGGFLENGQPVNYTSQYIVPYTSTCRDINLNSIYVNDPNIGWFCSYVRVRFFPSRGGNYANSWKFYCPSYGAKVMASNVGDGTRYRLEFQTNYVVFGQAFD